VSESVSERVGGWVRGGVDVVWCRKDFRSSAILIAVSLVECLLAYAFQV
jgi:hypothetical protein